MYEGEGKEEQKGDVGECVPWKCWSRAVTDPEYCCHLMPACVCFPWSFVLFPPSSIQVSFSCMGRYFVIVLSEMKARSESSTVVVPRITFRREGTDQRRFPRWQGMAGIVSVSLQYRCSLAQERDAQAEERQRSGFQWGRQKNQLGIFLCNTWFLARCLFHYDPFLHGPKGDKNHLRMSLQPVLLDVLTYCSIIQLEVSVTSKFSGGDFSSSMSHVLKSCEMFASHGPFRVFWFLISIIRNNKEQILTTLLEGNSVEHRHDFLPIAA